MGIFVSPAVAMHKGAPCAYWRLDAPRARQNAKPRADGHWSIPDGPVHCHLYGYASLAEREAGAAPLWSGLWTTTLLAAGLIAPAAGTASLAAGPVYVATTETGQQLRDKLYAVLRSQFAGTVTDDLVTRLKE
jgi:hypothetical protein